MKNRLRHDLGKIIFIGVAALTFAHNSCGAEYKVPDGQSTAKLRIQMPEPIYYSVFTSVFNEKKCKPASTLGWVSGGRKIDTVRVGMLDSVAPRQGILERVIAAGKPIAIGPSFAVANIGFLEGLFSGNPVAAQDIRAKQPAQCIIPIFTPISGAEYEMAIKLGPGSCELKLYRLNDNGDGTVSRSELSTDATEPSMRTTPLKCKK